MISNFNVDAGHDTDQISGEILITKYANQLLTNGYGEEKINAICKRLNEDLNNPALESTVVHQIINSVVSRSIRQKIINDLDLDIDLDKGNINYSLTSPARPFIFGRDVIPMNTLSVIGGLGGSGKSMAMVEMIGAAAIGDVYAKRSATGATCCLYLAFEDGQTELNARFSAVMTNYTSNQRELITKNVRAISMVGQRFQLIAIKNKNVEPTGLGDLLIEKLLELKGLAGLSNALLVIDHARLVASIEWNDAAQVTVLTQELHRIAYEAQAAVVLIAHSPKNTAAADHQVSQADIAGSSALVDNARYVGLVRGMSPSEAKELGIKPEARTNYLKLECIKSNYSKTGLIGWFLKTECKNHHVAMHTYVEPCKTSPIREGDSANESKIIKYVRANPDLTLTDLRKRAGKNGVLGMSDLKIRDVVNTLLEKGLLAHIPPTANYTKKTTPQFKGVLGVPSHV